MNDTLLKPETPDQLQVESSSRSATCSRLFLATDKNIPTPETDAHFPKYYDGPSSEWVESWYAKKLERERDELRRVLVLACKWGVASEGFSAEVSSSIARWVGAGMTGPRPVAPDYYPENDQALASEGLPAAPCSLPNNPITSETEPS